MAWTPSRYSSSSFSSSSSSWSRDASEFVPKYEDTFPGEQAVSPTAVVPAPR